MTVDQTSNPNCIEQAIKALEPFADIGQWLFVRDLPDDTPMVEVQGINNHRWALTRGEFKAAHAALTALRSALETTATQDPLGYTYEVDGVMVDAIYHEQRDAEILAADHRASGRPAEVIPLYERPSNETPEQLRVRLAKDIYDDGQDHHPPGYVGRKGDMVVIHSIQTAVVSHRGTGDGFVVHDGELELSSSQKAEVGGSFPENNNE